MAVAPRKTVTIPASELERLRRRAERAEGRTERLSMRLPASVADELNRLSAKTGLSKATLLLNAWNASQRAGVAG